MHNIIIVISGTVIVVNLIYALLPNGSYEKYSKHILGLILVLIFINSIVNVELSSEILNFDSQASTFSDEKIADTINAQTEILLEEKITKHLSDKGYKIKNIHVKLYEGNIDEITVISSQHKEKIYEIVSDFCDISKDKILVKQEVKTN